MRHRAYLPRTWRSYPLHICPADPFSWDDPSTRDCLNWIFFISSLNFSFWSELEGECGRYGVEWRDGWGSEARVVHRGYWSLVAGVNRGDSSFRYRPPSGRRDRASRCSDARFVNPTLAEALCSSRRGYPTHRLRILRVRDTMSGFIDRIRLPTIQPVNRVNTTSSRTYRRSSCCRFHLMSGQLFFLPH